MDAVGPLVTEAWLARARLSRQERERAERVGGGPLEPAFAERVAELWQSEPGLGESWTAWTA